jgi:hypothetical protein
VTNAPGDGGTINEDRQADMLVLDENEGGTR